MYFDIFISLFSIQKYNFGIFISSYWRLTLGGGGRIVVGENGGSMSIQLAGFVEVSPVLGSGVYALVKRGTVIYIGQSKSLYQRIYAHRHNARQAAKGKKIPEWLPARGFVFDQVFVLPCHVDDLDRVEREMINLYKPKYNESLKVGGNQVKAEVTLQIAGVAITMNRKEEGIRRL